MALLESTDVEIVALLQRREALLLLAADLGLEYDDQLQSNTRDELKVDHIYDVIKTCSEFGATWDELSQFANLCRDLQNDLEQDDLPQIIQKFKSGYDNRTTVSSRNGKLFAEYVFGTLMKHFHLYKYTMTRPREDKVVEYTVLVETPIEPAVSKTSQPLNVWEYERKYGQIDEKETDAKLKWQEKKETIQNLEPMKDKATKSTLSQAAEDENEMKNLIEQITSFHITNLNSRLEVNIQSVMEDLEYKFEKTSLPRPQALGQPPRFKAPTPIALKPRAKSPAVTKPPAQTAVTKPPAQTAVTKPAEKPQSRAKSRESVRSNKKK